MDKHNIAILVARPLAESIFDRRDLDVLAGFADYNAVGSLPETITPDFMRETLKGARGCVTCWGTPSFADEMMAGNPQLKLIAHAAGSVRALIPLSAWVAGLRVTSNAPVIAEDVAQTTLALMLTSLKQFWQFDDITKSGGWSGGEAGRFTTKRLDGLVVGLVGGSLVGKAVLKLLRPFGCEIILHDPYICEIEARELGVRLVSLEELLTVSDVISLHAPGNPDCRHMLNARNIPLIKDGALLINTARGILIDEPALIRELATGRFNACIDVTDPEPPASDHPFRSMKNVVLTPHIAGGHTVNGRTMLGRNVIRELYNYLTKGVLAYEVRPEMLERMA